MIIAGRKTFRPWMLLYASLVVTVMLKNHERSVSYSDAENLSPVIIGADAPALAIDELVRRSDI